MIRLFFSIHPRGALTAGNHTSSYAASYGVVWQLKRESEELVLLVKPASVTSAVRMGSSTLIGGASRLQDAYQHALVNTDDGN